MWPGFGTIGGFLRIWWKKLAANVARDRQVNRALRTAGWGVVRVWEPELQRRREERLARKLRRAFRTFTFLTTHSSARTNMTTRWRWWG